VDLTRKQVLAILTGCAFAHRTKADNTGSVSIVGTHDFESEGKHTVAITLLLSGKTWTKAEPGNRTLFFTSAGGKYQTLPASNIVQLLDKHGKIAGQIEDLIPAQAKKGDHRRDKGKSFERGITFDWEVV